MYRWNLVHEKNPTESGIYLVYGKETHNFPSFYMLSYWDNEAKGWEIAEDVSITHWHKITVPKNQ